MAARKDIFSQIIGRGIRAGATFPPKSAQARDWYRDAAKKVRHANPRSIIQANEDNLKKHPEIGNMYLFHYDAKHKDTLPYWDAYPLIFPIDYTKDGFYGINLHYLPPMLRAKLMDALFEHTTNNKYDKTMKLKISYQILKKASSLRYFKPCLKRYLYSHVRSQFLYVYPSEWQIALFLPLADWQKRTGNRVYADSIKAIG